MDRPEIVPDEFERRLEKLRPRSSNIARDHLMYLAGQASVRDESQSNASFGQRACQAWAVFSTAAAMLLAVQLSIRVEPQQSVSNPEPASHLQDSAATNPQTQIAETSHDTLRETWEKRPATFDRAAEWDELQNALANGNPLPVRFRNADDGTFSGAVNGTDDGADMNVAEPNLSPIRTLWQEQQELTVLTSSRHSNTTSTNSPDARRVWHAIMGWEKEL